MPSTCALLKYWPRRSFKITDALEGSSSSIKSRLGGITMWTLELSTSSKLLIVLLIVIVIFGTKRLSSIGGDLGGAVKGSIAG